MHNFKCRVVQLLSEAGPALIDSYASWPGS
jgi:hypothetical protein